MQSSKHYPFAKFDAKLAELDSYLCEGGLLALDCIDYRFADSSIAERYSPAAEDCAMTQPRPVYSKDNTRISDTYFASRIFQKRSSHAG